MKKYARLDMDVAPPVASPIRVSRLPPESTFLRCFDHLLTCGPYHAGLRHNQSASRFLLLAIFPESLRNYRGFMQIGMFAFFGDEYIVRKQICDPSGVSC